MRRVELFPALRDYLRYLGGLDERSLACCRILFGLVVLHDVSMAWPVLDIWAGLQGYYEGLPLPFLAPGGSEEWFLRVVFACYALAAVGLLLGYRTRWCSLGVWVMACGQQYAAGNAGDYHDQVLTNLLFWCQFFHLGRRWSVDARRPGQSVSSGSIEGLARGAFALNLAYLYFETALEKTGAGWWSEGTAVFFALKDFTQAAALGTWAVEHLPLEVFRVVTHAVLAVEFIAPLLLLSPWWRAGARLGGCGLLLGFQAGLWIFMALEAFPLTMIAAIVALLPPGLWTWVRNRRIVASGWLSTAEGREEASLAGSSSRTARQGLVQRGLWVLLGVGLLINLESHRLLNSKDEGRGAYPGAGHVVRLKYILGFEMEWEMYAPEPPAFSGWWVGVGITANGREVDPITGRPPKLEKPLDRGPAFEDLGGLYWFHEPGADGTPHHAFAHFLLWRDRRQYSPEERLEHFVLLYMYEPFQPLQNAAHPVLPLLVMRWPGVPSHPAPPLIRGSVLAGLQLYEADYERLGDEDWKPVALPAFKTY